MAYKKLPTLRRIAQKIIANPLCSDDDLRETWYAFNALTPVLKKIPVPEYTREQREIFYSRHDLMLEKMLFINDRMKERGFEEQVFTDPYSYQTSSDDYDYYFELKTEEQLKEEEAARKNAADL